MKLLWFMFILLVVVPVVATMMSAGFRLGIAH